MLLGERWTTLNPSCPSATTGARGGDEGGAALWAGWYHDPAKMTCFSAVNGVFLCLDCRVKGEEEIHDSAVVWWKLGICVATGRSSSPGTTALHGWEEISSSQLGHTNGQGASNPGAPCSPFSPLGPFLPFFPFSPCGYNDLVKLTSFFWTFGTALLLGGEWLKSEAAAHKGERDMVDVR